MTFSEAIAALEKMKECEENEEFEPPSDIIIDRAVEIIKAFDAISFPDPLRVVMNGEGGVTLEWRKGNAYTTLEVKKDKKVELCQFKDGKLIWRSAYGRG